MANHLTSQRQISSKSVESHLQFTILNFEISFGPQYLHYYDQISEIRSCGRDYGRKSKRREHYMRYFRGKFNNNERC